MKAETKLFFVCISLFIFFAFLYLLPSVFSVLIAIERIDPIVLIRPQVYTFVSALPLYVRGASLTISGDSVTGVTVTVYNGGISGALVTIHVEIYDDANKIVRYGSGGTYIYPLAIVTVDIPIDPPISYLVVYRVRVRLTRGDIEPSHSIIGNTRVLT